MKRIPWMMAILSAIALLDLPAGAQVYNLHLVTDNQPDYTDLKSFVASSTGAWKTPEEKAIAVWRWGRRSRRQLSCSREGTRYICDPILNYNSYGALNCGIISALNNCSFVELGFQARYVQLGDHTVSEVSWDQGRTWHLFDSSMSAFCYNHEGQIASCEEIKEAHGCELSGGKVEPGHYYLYHPAPQCASHLGPTGWRCASDNPVEFERTLAHGAESYTDGFSVDKGCQYARSGHRYVLNIRPFESYTRHWTPADNSHLDPAARSLDFYRPLPDGKDPDGQRGPGNVRSNGRWIFQPDLGDPACEKLFFDSAGVRLSRQSPKLAPAKAGQRAFAVFQVSAANVITSMQIDAEGACGAEAGQLRIAVSRDAGIRWKEVWSVGKAGTQSIRLRLRDEVAGTPLCWIRIEMLAGATDSATGLDSLKVVTNTLVNRLTLPALTLGSNQVLLRADEQLATIELWPFLHANLHKQTVLQEDGVFSDELPDGAYKATLGSAQNNRECSATWKLEAPTPIVGVTYAVTSTVRTNRHWVSLRHSWDGQKYEEFARHADGGFPLDRRTVRQFKEGQVPADARQAFFRSVFFSPSGAGTYNMAGLQDLLIRIHHQPRSTGFTPFEVTYNWTEHRETGDVTRSHTERVRQLPHRYAINIAGRRNPTMNWVRINLPGHSPDGLARAGYSDGVDVGPGAEPARVSYRWGRNIAQGRPYAVSRPSAASNPDSDGRELTNGIAIAPTEYATAAAVQPATALWDAGEPVACILDLGESRTIGGVRIVTHQPSARYCHPRVIDVSVSADGRAWAPAGVIRHDDLWNPPGDYEAWEHDDDARFAKLPAGGRLAYPYPLALLKPVSGRYVRLIFMPLDARGMGLSEIQVFDAVTTIPSPAEILLPDGRPGK